eukprot:scaffold59538_cov32-Prasinocladus_malaysianus.AAC.1
MSISLEIGCAPGLLKETRDISILACRFRAKFSAQLPHRRLPIRHYFKRKHQRSKDCQSRSFQVDDHPPSTPSFSLSVLQSRVTQAGAAYVRTRGSNGAGCWNSEPQDQNSPHLRQR